MKSILVALAGLAMSLVLVSAASAATLTLNFTGIVTSTAKAGVLVNDDVTGTLTIPNFSTAYPNGPDSYQTIYSHAPTSFSVAAGTVSGGVATTNAAGTFANYEPSQPIVGQFFYALSDFPTRTELSIFLNWSSLISPLTLASMPVNQTVAVFAGGAGGAVLNDDGFSFDVETFSVTVTPTPIPAGLPLFASALGGLGILGWRGRRPQAAR